MLSKKQKKIIEKLREMKCPFCGGNLDAVEYAEYDDEIGMYVSRYGFVCHKCEMEDRTWYNEWIKSKEDNNE